MHRTRVNSNPLGNHARLAQQGLRRAQKTNKFDTNHPKTNRWHATGKPVACLEQGLARKGQPTDGMSRASPWHAWSRGSPKWDYRNEPTLAKRSCACPTSKQGLSIAMPESLASKHTSQPCPLDNQAQLVHQSSRRRTPCTAAGQTCLHATPTHTTSKHSLFIKANADDRRT